MNNIKTKFKIGDRAYYVIQMLNLSNAKCDVCEYGEVFIKSQKFKCPKCWGKRYINTLSWEVVECKIKKIEVKIWEYMISIVYSVENNKSGLWDREEAELFSSHDKAQAECNKRNSESEV